MHKLILIWDHQRSYPIRMHSKCLHTTNARPGPCTSLMSQIKLCSYQQHNNRQLGLIRLLAQGQLWNQDPGIFTTPRSITHPERIPHSPPKTIPPDKRFQLPTVCVSSESWTVRPEHAVLATIEERWAHRVAYSHELHPVLSPPPPCTSSSSSGTTLD